MSRTTTTLFEIFISELHLQGKNEFYNNNQLTFFDDKFAFMKKAMSYDDDVKKIVNEKFFVGVELATHDDEFKRMFLNRFLNSEIICQTLDLFGSLCSYMLLENKRYLDSVYSNYDKFVTSEHTTTTNATNSNLHKNRNAYQELPQDEVNIDLNDDTFDYASTNGISLDKSQSDNQSDNLSKSYNVDNLLRLDSILDNVLTKFDRKCFLQVYS